MKYQMDSSDSRGMDPLYPGRHLKAKMTRILNAVFHGDRDQLTAETSGNLPTGLGDLFPRKQ